MAEKVPDNLAAGSLRVDIRPMANLIELKSKIS